LKVQLNLSALWQGLAHRTAVAPTRAESQLGASLKKQLQAAHQEWQIAEQYFQTVSEPELVDHAIFTLEAARRKYVYLFRQLREARLNSSDSGGVS
jgi:predicted metal-binding protein